MRRRARVDASQPEIVAALRGVGVGVQVLSAVGHGCPDLAVGYRHKTYLIELKEGKSVLTPDERAWHDAWPGAAYVARSVEDVLRIIGLEVVE